MGGKWNKGERFAARKAELKDRGNHYWENVWNWKKGIGKKKDHACKIFTLERAWESVKQKQGAEIMGGSNLHKCRLTVKKRRILFKRTKKIREICEFVKVVYNKLISY